MFRRHKILSLAVSFGMLSLVLFSATACNTMAGVGRDVEKAGDSLEDSAQRHKNY